MDGTVGFRAGFLSPQNGSRSTPAGLPLGSSESLARFVSSKELILGSGEKKDAVESERTAPGTMPTLLRWCAPGVSIEFPTLFPGLQLKRQMDLSNPFESKASPADIQLQRGLGAIHETSVR